MSKAVANITILTFAISVPLLLYVAYVSIMRGRASSNVALHYGCMFGVVACALPFIAMLRARVAVRVAAAIVIGPVVFLVTQIGGAYFACIVFGSCP